MWFLRPFGFDSSIKWPMVHLIHGGPESARCHSHFRSIRLDFCIQTGSFNDAWSYRWNYQLFASAGYATVFMNPRGSPGWGQKFTDAVLRDWGGAFDSLCCCSVLRAFRVQVVRSWI